MSSSPRISTQAGTLEALVRHNRNRPQRPDRFEQQNRGGDRVELSNSAVRLSRLSELPQARADRIEQVRQEILAGKYITDDKIDAAIDRLAEEMF